MVSAEPYEERTYRSWSGREGLDSFCIRIGTSDLRVQCAGGLRDEAYSLLADSRTAVERVIATEAGFGESLVPVPRPRDRHAVVDRMFDASLAWDVGPMAAVAGAIAQAVGQGLLERSDEVIVENGGDLFLLCSSTATVALYAGESSPFRDRLAFRLEASGGMGVCTSSGVVGPSLSLGKADAVMAVSRDCAFADAAATAIANRVKSPRDVDPIIEEEAGKGRLEALVICCGNKLGVWGSLELATPGNDENER